MLKPLSNLGNRVVQRYRAWKFKLDHVAVGTYSLAAFTCALVVVSVLQYLTLQSTDDATQKAAKAAQDSASTARDALVAVQRAFVNMSQVTIDRAVKDGKPAWQFSVHWINNGSIPTQQLNIYHRCPHGQINVKDPTTLDLENIWHAKRYLGPKQETIAGSCTFSPDAVKTMQDQNSFLWLISRAEYRDALHATGAPLVTEFCAQVTNIKGDPLMQGELHMELDPCTSGHNCGDDDCTK